MRNYGVDYFFYKPLPILDEYEQIAGESRDEISQDQRLQIKTDKEVYHKRGNVKIFNRLHER